jgi:hypothetical protein
VKDIENWGEFFGRRQVQFSVHVVCSDQETSITATQKLGGCRNDIMAGMKLVSDAMARSVAAQKFLFFNFSGHGTQVRDDDGDEADGLDEALCPCDFETAGVISTMISVAGWKRCPLISCLRYATAATVAHA